MCVCAPQHPALPSQAGKLCLVFTEPMTHSTSVRGKRALPGIVLLLANVTVLTHSVSSLGCSTSPLTTPLQEVTILMETTHCSPELLGPGALHEA